MMNQNECGDAFGPLHLGVTQIAVWGRGAALKAGRWTTDTSIMRTVWIALAWISLSCGSEAADKTAKVERTLPHSGYSEGLDFYQGKIWHALPKKLVTIDPKTGEVLETFKPATKYSESLTWFKGKLYNVSYSDNGLYVGTRKGKEFQFRRVGSVPEAHAWGLTHDGTHLIVTGNYSNKLYFLDPATAKVKRTLVVQGSTNIEDLAWDGEALWSSSFTKHKGTIFRIDVKTGKISHFFKLPNPESCPVVDGIAFDGKGFWVTGKHCVSLHYIPHPLRASGKKSAPRASASK